MIKYLLLSSLLLVASCDKGLHSGAGLGISTVVAGETGSKELGCLAAVVAGGCIDPTKLGVPHANPQD